MNVIFSGDEAAIHDAPHNPCLREKRGLCQAGALTVCADEREVSS